MMQKANLLSDMGRCGEAVRIYKECLTLESDVNNVAIAQQLDEIRTEHEVENMEKDLRSETLRGRITAVACLSLLITIVVILVYYVRTRKTNAILINNIREQEHRREMEKAQAENAQNAEQKALMEQWRKIVEYMDATECYTGDDYGRADVMAHFGITERQLSTCVAQVEGVTFITYSNILRLDHAVGLMSHSPKMTITQISEACGFGTLRQFQRQFKSRFGVSPTDYIEVLGDDEDKN